MERHVRGRLHLPTVRSHVPGRDPHMFGFSWSEGVTVQASCCLFNLPLADMVDAGLLKFNRQSPLSSMAFGISTLFTKPAQSLAPMVILSRLNQCGYGDPSERDGTDPTGSLRLSQHFHKRNYVVKK
ncbi:hypothetical protein mRhiFer1_009534 [Rhinolophus ferrumequinum]|uniref:Uncharacterized protein n=1 Tax=Rhinolophus ferrumequinum TaxID=59479 RepID=A0A7J7R8E2_RHIFE|nr:hypothetical protein mRhiFer1_009534 [Rhinolophus ferrumequinum]